MFGLFKKKKEEPSPAAVPAVEQETACSENPEQEVRKTFLAQFTGEETDIIAITGPGGVTPVKVEGTELWGIVIGLTAWVDEYTQELHREPARLEAMVDETLLEYLSVHTPRNFIIAVTVRPAEEGNRFLMTDLPKPGFDADLKAILEEQKKPITMEADGLGTFTLNRALGWYDATVDWMGCDISLNLDQAEETLAAAQETARTLMNAQADWDARVRAFAAQQLLERANALLEEDEDAEPFTLETLAAQFQPDSLLAGPDGAFEFWFSDDDLFLAHPVHVTGTLAQGPALATMED